MGQGHDAARWLAEWLAPAGPYSRDKERVLALAGVRSSGYRPRTAVIERSLLAQSTGCSFLPQVCGLLVCYTLVHIFPEPWMPVPDHQIRHAAL